LWCYFILGWWFVNVDEEQGWVPAAYLESEDGNTNEFENILVSSGGQPLIYNTYNNPSSFLQSWVVLLNLSQFVFNA